MCFLEDGKLSRLNRSLEWRDGHLDKREKSITRVSDNLKRVWKNFMESVIQFPPTVTTALDRIGIADELKLLTSKDRQDRLDRLGAQRVAASEINEIISTEWAEEKLTLPLSVPSMLQVQEKIAQKAEELLTPNENIHSPPVVFNKGGDLSA